MSQAMRSVHEENVTVFVNPPHHRFRPDHLDHVIAEMCRRGPPVIRASWDAQHGVWHAREGTHRLRAALALGLVPVIVRVLWNRTTKARERARFAALRNAHAFDRVEVQGS